MSGTATLIQLLGGVALLIFGLHQVKQGLLKAYGGKLRRLVGRHLSSRISAFTVGLGITCLLQSSTATALLASSFAGQGMSTAAGLALLLGADVGTTVVAQILTFDLSLLQPMVLLGGVVVYRGAKREKIRQIGLTLIGLGLMLLALSLIVSSSQPMRYSPLMQSLLTSLSSEPVLAVIVGTLIAFLAHSSLATVLLIVALSSSGVLSFTGGVALILGANIGAALPAVLNTVNALPAVRRAPIGNLLFRLFGVLFILPWITPLSEYFNVEEGPRQLVNFHFLFNVALTVMFLPWIHYCAQLVELIVPDQVTAEDDNSPRHLDRSAFRTPSVALSNSVREVLRMGDLLRVMIDNTFEALDRSDSTQLQTIKRSDDLIDEYYDKINCYLNDLSRLDIPKKYRSRCYRLSSYVTNLEHVGDIVECSLTDVIAKMLKSQVKLSKKERKTIASLHDQINQNMELAFSVLLTGDVKNARSLLEQKTLIKNTERNAVMTHHQNLGEQTIRYSGSNLYLDLLRDLNRINSYFASIAYPILEQAGELRSSRLRQVMTEDDTEQITTAKT